MGALRDADDLQAVLAVIDAARDSDPPPAGLPDGVLRQLDALIRCDAVSYFEFDIAECAASFNQVCVDGEVTTVLDDPGGATGSPFFEHYWNTLSCSYPSRTGDDRTVTMQSDFYSQRQWRSTAMYNDCFRDLGYHYEVMCCLPTQGTRARRVLFFRSGEVDFTESDRLLLSLLRPHLGELSGDLLHARGAAPNLTPRQWQLLTLVAAGHTNAEIAARLYLSANTVRTHLENIFERLQVTTRTAAVARAFPHAR
ncbi:MAG TPA: helix-turn-helix transcriptional regulator [Acidimicrobiales bacterium]|nr:helix-turn-helix transcriptional regulator [Acidimicrobiales bacterium]